MSKAKTEGWNNGYDNKVDKGRLSDPSYRAGVEAGAQKQQSDWVQNTRKR